MYKVLFSSLFFVLFLLLSACQPVSSDQAFQNDNVANIHVNTASPIENRITSEPFPLPNCGGTGEIHQTLGSAASITKSVTVSGKATIKGGGEGGIPETVKLKLEIEIEAAYQKTYESANSRLDMIDMPAAAGTHVEYEIDWYEQSFSSLVEYSSNGQVYEAPYTYKLRVPKIGNSKKVACPPTEITNTNSPSTQPQTVSQPTTLSINATQQCQQFGGTPISANNITFAQISNWRVGQVDKPTVGRIIYCEIHQIPGYSGFVEGNTIPANAIITADLGFNWDSRYPQSLERLAHEGGGWGVFLTLKPIVVQHANDLNHSVGGQYWLISQ